MPLQKGSCSNERHHMTIVATHILHCMIQYFMEQINNLKVNRARLRKALRKVYLKIYRKVHARFLRKARAAPAQGCARSAHRPSKARVRPAQGPRKACARPRPRPVLKKTSVSQMIDLVMTIQTVQESSKSELSSRFLSTSKFLLCQKSSKMFA